MLPVVRKSSNITRISQLHGKKFCHPGYGYEQEWTKVISHVCMYIAFSAEYIVQICVYVNTDNAQSVI